MLNVRKLFGGGARALGALLAMLMCTTIHSRVNGQITGGWDPTPINQFTCNGLLLPPGIPAYAGDPAACYPATRLPDGPWALLPNESWIHPDQAMGAVGSPRDRRPAFFLQCWNGSWTTNPYGLADWWVNWRQNPQTGVWEDAPRDERGLDPVSLVWSNGANGVPDQFEELFFRFETMWRKGLRRFILKLPGGVAYGKATYTYVNGVRYDFYTGQNQPMNQWRMMPKWKREWFLGFRIDDEGNWIGALEDLRHPGSGQLPAWYPWQRFGQHVGDGDWASTLKLEIYIGCNIQSGTCTPCEDTNPWPSGTYLKNPPVGGFPTGVDIYGQYVYDPVWFTGCSAESQAIDFDPRKQVHMNHVDRTLRPWYNVGITRIWLDAGNDNFDADGRRKRFGVLQLAHCPDYSVYGGSNTPFSRLSFGAEALPWHVWSEPDPTLDDCALSYAPWCALSQVYTSWDPDGGGPYGTGRAFYPSLLVNPDLTEVHLLVNPSRTAGGVMEPNLTFEEYGAIRDRGFVISVYNFSDNTGADPAYNERLLNRWYSMGRILVPDFDGNGEVNQADYDKAYAAMHPTQQPERHVFATGNVYNSTANPTERIVDENDWNFWLAAWTARQNGVHSGPQVEVDLGYAKSPDLR